MRQGDGKMKRIGVLALQGGIEEHHHLLGQIQGITSLDVKYKEQLKEIDGLIIPGGESTTLGRLLRTFDLLEPLREKIKEGLPVWGTCAGMILLAREIENESTKHLEMMDITVRRNAYGRQMGSFEVISEVEVVGKAVPMVFIRAPLVTKVGANVQILAKVEGEIVACKEGNKLVTSFHPELTKDISFHQYFVRGIS